MNPIQFHQNSEVGTRRRRNPNSCRAMIRRAHHSSARRAHQIRYPIRPIGLALPQRQPLRTRKGQRANPLINDLARNQKQPSGGRGPREKPGQIHIPSPPLSGASPSHAQNAHCCSWERPVGTRTPFGTAAAVRHDGPTSAGSPPLQTSTKGYPCNNGIAEPSNTRELSKSRACTSPIALNHPMIP